MFGLFAKKDLSGGDVVRQTYARMIKDLRGEEQRLPRELLLVIADDSDHHRSRTGYMRYEEGGLVTVGERRVFLAVGAAWGDYPARPYDCDLLALSVTWEWSGPEDVRKHYEGPFGAMVRAGMVPFNDSLLVAMASGALESPSRFGKRAERVRELLGSPDMQAHAVQDVERDARYVAASDLQPVVSRPARFSSKIVDPLAANLIEILSA